MFILLYQIKTIYFDAYGYFICFKLKYGEMHYCELDMFIYKKRGIVMAGKLILLNGTSSSGKTTLAKEFIKQRSDYFYVGIDDFDLFIQKIEDRDNNHLIPIDTDYFFNRIVKTILDQGINVIMDSVIYTKEIIDDFIEIFKGYEVTYIKVTADPQVLELREKNRGDRNIGLALSQIELMNTYDAICQYIIDTTYMTIEEAVKKITEIA